MRFDALERILAALALLAMVPTNAVAVAPCSRGKRGSIWLLGALVSAVCLAGSLINASRNATTHEVRADLVASAGANQWLVSFDWRYDQSTVWRVHGCELRLDLRERNGRWQAGWRSADGWNEATSGRLERAAQGACGPG